MISARSVAVQGVGYGRLLASVQGLLPEQQVTPSVPPVAEISMGGGSFFSRRQQPQRRPVSYDQQNSVILMTVVSAVTSGVLDDD